MFILWGLTRELLNWGTRTVEGRDATVKTGELSAESWTPLSHTWLPKCRKAVYASWAKSWQMLIGENNRPNRYIDTDSWVPSERDKPILPTMKPTINTHIPGKHSIQPTFQWPILTYQLTTKDLQTFEKSSIVQKNKQEEFRGEDEIIDTIKVKGEDTASMKQEQKALIRNTHKTKRKWALGNYKYDGGCEKFSRIFEL